MRLPALTAAALIVAATTASAAPSGADLFSTICLANAPELSGAQIDAAAGPATDGIGDAHVEAKSGRFCELRLGPGQDRPAVTRNEADALVAAFSDRAGGTILDSEAQDGGQAFSYRVKTGGDLFIVLLKNEGPKRFFMIKRTGR